MPYIEASAAGRNSYDGRFTAAPVRWWPAVRWPGR